MILCSAIFSNVWIILFHLALYLFYSISYHIFQLFLSIIIPEILIHFAILQRFYLPPAGDLILHKKYSFSQHLSENYNFWQLAIKSIDCIMHECYI